MNHRKPWRHDVLADMTATRASSRKTQADPLGDRVARGLDDALCNARHQDKRKVDP